MIGSLTLPALAFLGAISGLPGLPALPGIPGLTGLPQLKLPRPASKEHVRAKAAAVAADTLPVPWKPSWRLALESRFVRVGLTPIGTLNGPIHLTATNDPRRLHVSIDPDSGVYRSSVGVGDVALGTGFRRRLDQFSLDMTKNTLREHWQERSRRELNSIGAAAPTQRPGISVPIHVPLPSPVRTILGPGEPSLNVSGSESIRLSGTSNWTNQQLGLLGRHQSLFPSLDMQQDLDIRLEGQLSDRVKVNMLQNSANQVPLANRTAINYRGDEDDFIQALDLGNTNLALPGTQYVSYSGRNEGLFGVKMASRIGALDFTVLASKQEGRSERAVYTGGASRNKFQFTDLDWIRGQYFLFYDPNFGTAYDIDDNSIRLYLDDGVASNDLGKVILGKAVIDPDTALKMPLAPSQSPDSAFVRGSFNLLNPGPDKDYEILKDLYQFDGTTFKVIRLKQPIPLQSNQTLAVTYRAAPIIVPGHALGKAVDVGGRVLDAPPADSGHTLMKLLRVPREKQSPTSEKPARYDTTAALSIVRELELKNLYNLGGFGIDSKSFKLTLQSGQGDPPITDLGGIPFIEMVGLDNWNEQTSQAQPGHDGEVDAIGFNSQTRGWVDYTNGVLFLPDPRAFAPRLAAPNALPFDKFIDGHLNRRRRLDGLSDSLNAPNPKGYELYNPQTFDAAWYFNAEYAAARTGGSDITLGRGNLLENSESVVVNGERWQRDRDYTIDYDLGRLTLKRQLGPSDQLSVDYSYAPLFAQASKTLVGSAFRLEGRERSLGGAFLYESRGAQDLRPRLGEEPARTLITDLNADWRFKPAFLTRLADALPGVRTTTPSEFNIQAEGGMSFPNPNTRNEVFVDDMEGVRDAVSLALSPDRWRWSSVPTRSDAPLLGSATNPRSFLTLTRQRNAEVHWFTPVNTQGSRNDNELIHERDLRPRLSDAQGGQNVRNVLGISIPRTPTGFTPGDTMWAGLTYNLDAVGLDLTRSQFLEIWVNDWNDHHDPAFRDPRVRGNGTPGSSVKLHIDLGRVSEDQMRAPNRLPNGRIDTEDVPPRDNQLTVTEGNSEDTGIDGRNDAQEQAQGIPLADLSTATGSDPEGDTWGNIVENFTSTLDPRRYVNTNGTEGNGTAFPTPDTEDMNLNDRPDTTESYFEYTIDLGDKSSPYLGTDIVRDFPSPHPPGDVYFEPDSTRNGWRRYRIPLTDSLRVRFGFPDLSITQHVRVWLEGLQRDERTSAAALRPMLMIGGLDIVGSRWQSADLTPRQRDVLHTTVTLNSVNTVDNADIYSAPFDPGTTRNGSQAFQRREQSLALEFADIWPADTLEAFKTFSIPENYSRYGTLRWFATGFKVSKRGPAGNELGRLLDSDSLSYFVRFASDEKGQNYYELKRRITAPDSLHFFVWEEVLAELEKLSVVKLNSDFPPRDPILYSVPLPGGEQLTIKGHPSFTRLLRISFGVLNEDTTRGYRYTGQLWFDEVRATDVAKDVGLANRLLVNGRWANLMDYNVAWDSRDADFLKVGESRGSGSRTSSLAVSTRIEPHRFFEGTGILVPVSFSQNQSSSRPRFSAGDDIVRSGALADASETRATSRSMTASYSRVWSERSNPFLKSTLGGITANISRTTNDARSPTAVSKSTNVGTNVSYQLTPREWVRVPVPFTKLRLFPLPERLYWNYAAQQAESRAFTRQFGSSILSPSSSQNGRSASVDFGADIRPFDLLSQHVEGRRNLTLDGVRRERIGFINLGRLTSWRQAFTSHLVVAPNQWVRPSFNWSSSYNQVNDTQSPNLQSRSISNSQELGMNWDLPFDRLSGPRMAAPRPVTPTVPDTAGGRVGAGSPVTRTRRPLLPWRGFLSHLGAISTDGRIGRNTNYSRLAGTASPLYLLGLADNPGFGRGNITAQPGNTSSGGLDWRGNAHTSLPLAFGSSISTRFGYGDRTTNNSGVKTRSRDWRFPDFEVQYGRVANVLGLTRILTTPQLRTAYARNNSVEYQYSRSVRSSSSRSDDFRPLLSVRGRLKNGADAEMSYERRSSVRSTFLSGTSVATDQTTDINFKLSRSYSQGQRMNVLGKTSTVNTNVSLTLATVYSHQTGGIKVANVGKLADPIDRTRMSVNGTGSFGFSSTVTGDIALGFSSTRESNGIFRRSIRVELRGQLRF